MAGTAREDIAIVGVGCRFPGGVRDAEALWRVFAEGRDMTTPVPADRWGERFHDADRRPGTTYCGRGAFLDDVDRFDAGFFGITAREADEMDPQQRLLLETAWAAMEDSGTPRDSWNGTRTGVYAGILAMDYTVLHAKTLGVEKIDPYYASGKEFSFGAGRIAYTFGLHGPCVTVNSACSSSLMAVHLACQALRSGECDAAVAAGVNVMLTPELSVFMSKIEALSPSSKCRPFDAAADGVTRGEGCGAVVLRRLSDAVRDGDRIWAVVRGSAANHDGRSAGLTAPNPVAQEALLREAWHTAGVSPAKLGYVEAHGTGTPLGDPIELSALSLAAAGHRTPGRPLFVGSHKANFGHLDSAAGMLGLLKAVLVARHREVPPQIGVERPTPMIDWARSGLAVATERKALPARGPVFAGVSAFGLSGSNCHVVVESPPVGRRVRRPGPAAVPMVVRVLTVSGPTPEALAAQVAAYRDVVADAHDSALPDLLYSAAARRTHHAYRLAVAFDGRDDLLAALDSAAENAEAGVLADGRPPRVVHRFDPDSAADWAGFLGRWRCVGSVREVCDAHPGWKESAEVAALAGPVALSKLWSAWGLPPSLVEGEIPAGAFVVPIDPAQLDRTLAAAHQTSLSVDWALVFGSGRRYVPLPPVPLAGRRHWLPGVEPGQQGGVVGGLEGLRAEVRLVDADGRAVAAFGVGSGSESVAAIATPGAVAATTPAVPTPTPAPEPVARPALTRDQVAARVGAVAAEILGLEQGRHVPRTRGFYELGMGSFTLAEFSRRLHGEFGVEVDESAGIDHPTVERMTDFLVAALAALPAEPAAVPAVADAGVTAAAVVAEPADPVEPSASTVPPADEPVAIVGMACRLPGAETLDAFWNLLRDGIDATGEVPAERWDADELPVGPGGVPGAVATGRGAFLGDVAGFDNAFFRVSAREARAMDPQQRLFLEVAWEALDDAGLDAHALRGGATGLFVGLNTTDYQQLVTRHRENVDLYYGTGNSFSGTAGRLSYFLGVHGPSLAVDTACSSSLAAVHLACQSLRGGESTVAVAGGANVIATPTVYLAMSAGGALAPDGRCKTFDAAADGYGRGEGAVALVLKTLSRARADGDRVYALIRGSAVNHNGASGGLTVPDGGAQQEVIATALARAGVAPAAIDYVEAHGTGTPLGDRVELGALAAALAPGRPADRPLLVGSVKTNIGHLEAAAGAAGLAKTVLALRHGEIPAQINCPHPTTRPGIAIASRPTPWPTPQRLAGVSAFGFTGTNAHVVIEASSDQGSAPAVAREVPSRPLVLALSATTPAALTSAARRMRERLADASEKELADVCYTAGARRTHWEYRAAVVGSDRAQLDRGLAAVESGRAESDQPLLGRARPGEPARLVLVFGDEIGRFDVARLLREEPAARAAFDEVDREARAILGRPVRAGDTDPVAVFAAQTALTALWHVLGVRADAFAGRGLGEVAAAHAAGALTLRAALLAASGVGGARLATASRPLHLDSLVDGGDWSPPSAAGSREWDPRTAAALAPAGTETVALDVAFGPGARRLASLAGDRSTTLAGADLTAAEADEPVRTVARLHVAGVPVDWTALHGGRGRVVSLPAYPWQRERHWIDVSALSDGTAGHTPVHPYLAASFCPAELPGRTYFTARVPAAATTVGLPWLAEALLGAARTLVGGALRLEGLRPRVPLVTPADAADTQIVAVRRGSAWHLTVVGELAAEVTVRRAGATADTGSPTGRHLIPPAILDAALRTLTADAAEPQFVVGIDAIDWRADVPNDARFDSRATELGGDVTIQSPDGTPLVVLQGIRLAPQSAHVLVPESRERLESRLYDVRWRRLDARFETAQRIEGPWLVHPASPEASPTATSVVEALRGAGADAVLDDTRPPAAIVLVTAGVQDPSRAVAALVSAIRDEQTSAPLWLVAGPDAEPAQAAVWSIGRVLAMEAPNRWAGMVGVDDDADLTRVAFRLLAAPPAADADAEDELRLRDGEWYVPRLTHAEPLPPVVAAPRLDGDRWYALTDALAAHNAPILEWLVEHGARAIADVPTTDQGSPPDRDEALAAHGVTLRTIPVQSIRSGPEAALDIDLAGVVVTAAPTPTRPLPDSDPAARINETEALLALDLLTRAQARPLDFFHIIGSAAAAWGTVGTAERAAVEGIADAVAGARLRDRQPVSILRCMPRADSGELSSRDRVLMAECGLRPLAAADVAEAFDAFARAGLATANAMLADVDESAYVRACRTAARRAWLAEFASTVQTDTTDSPDPAGRTPLALELAALPSARRADRLADLVLDAVAEVLGAGSSPDPRQGFFDMGMDSVMSLALRNRLADVLAVDLPSTLTFEFPTPAALVEHLTDELVRTGPASREAEAPSTPATSRPQSSVEAPEPATPHLQELQPPTAPPETPPDYDELSDPALLGRLTDLLASSEALLAQEGGAW